MAAVSSNLGEQIRDELSCSICLELFTRPKVLPCQHTFCQDCLQELARKDETFQCPNCRLQVSLPSEGVEGFPDSCFMANMCERLQNKATLTEKTSEQPLSENRCSLHPSEELKVYCKQCQIPVCEQCLEGAHDDHRITTIKKAAQERRFTVQALIDEGRNILESYCNFIRDLREKEKTLNEQKQQTSSIILAYSTFLSEVEQNHRRNLDTIQKERIRVLADVNELSAACDRAEQEMKQGRIEFLNQETLLAKVVGKYRGKAAPTPVQTQPAVFQPTDSPVSLLGHVMVQSFPSTPIPAAPTCTSSNGAAGGTGHHHGNPEQEEYHQYQRLTFGGRGSNTGQFDNPSGVTVSKEGEIFVADFWNRRIQLFTLQGIYVWQFEIYPVSESTNPENVAMNIAGKLWMVGRTKFDNNFALQFYFDKQNNRTNPMKNINLQRTGWSRGVAVDTKKNYILITQSTGDWPKRNGEVQVFREDGKLVRVVGQQQGMKYPQHITVDGEGNILVSDYDNHCIYVYNDAGQFLFKFGG
ncbi:tripartite motif-containing protein 2-like [Branchiostoma lanceolatum]|uniref:tripartite motif-containing protein 2-like n=1 Tax=Branchiostoma lanceolatum TaxID=7740 RepID=UPI003453A764